MKEIKKRRFERLRNHPKANALLGIILIIILFLVVSYFVKKNIEIIKPFIVHHAILGIVIYTIILILEVVLLPITAIPLIPIMSNSYGFSVAFLVTLFGWFFGAMFSFGLARRFGKPLIKKIISLEELEQFEALFSEKHKFFGLVLIRVLIPFDALNYFFGIFTRIKTSTFAITTFFGGILITFLLVYAGSLPILLQIIGGGIGILIIIAIWIVIKFLGYSKIRHILKYYGFKGL